MVEAPVIQQPEAPAVPAAGAEVRLTSAQLKERLDETRAAAERRVLAELGVDSLDKAKERVAKAAQIAQDEESDESPKRRRLKELETTAAQQAAKLAEMESLLAAVTHERATNTLSSLPEQARKAIEDATDDAEERIALAQVFAAAGFSGVQPVSAPVVQPPIVAPVVSTAPPRSAPADASATPPNRKQEYDRLRKENPVAAAHYLKAFSRDIFPGT
jgi:hypothetical protein